MDPGAESDRRGPSGKEIGELTVDIRFTADRVLFRMNPPLRTPEKEKEVELPSVFRMQGYACPSVDDRYGPPEEWKYLSTDQIWTMERIPLVATVEVQSDAAWHAEVDARIGMDTAEPPKGLGSDGKPLDADLWGRMVRANSELTRKHNAQVWYWPPETPDEFTSRYEARLDAHLQIVLRLSEMGLARWHELCLRFLGSHLVPCTLTLMHLDFAQQDENTARGGLPTWSRFVEGQFPARAFFSFLLRAGTEWDDVKFT
jgi:hypothetical protein